MSSRAWAGLTIGNDDSIVYDAKRVQLAYERINANRQPLFPTVHSYQAKLSHRAKLIHDKMLDPKAAEPDYHLTLAGRAVNKKKNGGTFSLAPARGRTGPSQFDDPGLDMTVLPDHKLSGGRVSMQRPPSEIERHIQRTADMPGPLHYECSINWNSLKPGPRMMLSKNTTSKLKKLNESLSAPILQSTNMNFDKAVRPRPQGGYMSGKLYQGPKLFTTPGPNEYKQHLPIHVRERIKGGIFSQRIEETAPRGPAPHDYQNPLADRIKGLSHGSINPFHTNSIHTTGENWWKRGRGPGKYKVNENILLPAPKLVSMNPYPMAAENAYHRARDRGIELASSSPGPSDYFVDDTLVSVPTKGLAFSQLSAVRSFGQIGNSYDVPYLNPPMPGTTNIHEGSGNRIGFTLGSRTVLVAELEQIKRATEPSSQSYDAINSEPQVYKKAPAFTIGAKPFNDDLCGPIKGPGPATYEVKPFSQKLMGATRISTRGSRDMVRFAQRAATISLPLPEATDPGIPGPGEYVIDGNAEFGGGKKGALIGREMDPNADLKALLPKNSSLFNGPGPGAFDPKIGRKGSGSSIGGRLAIHQKQQREAIVRRAKLAMLKARRSSAATWNG
jgi:hypothetical protein